MSLRTTKFFVGVVCTLLDIIMSHQSFFIVSLLDFHLQKQAEIFSKIMNVYIRYVKQIL